MTWIEKNENEHLLLLNGLSGSLHRFKEDSTRWYWSYHLKGRFHGDQMKLQSLDLDSAQKEVIVLVRKASDDLGNSLINLSRSDSKRLNKIESKILNLNAEIKKLPQEYNYLKVLMEDIVTSY